jgi:hypothetical protein
MANKLNTVAKGDKFENIVFIKMKELLEADKIGLSPTYSKIFQKKAYRGTSGNEIVFDIAIETYHSDSNEISTLTLIECKDHKASIQSRDIRDFDGRIKDVRGQKGYFITTSKFQEGALNEAKSKRIGLAKFNIARLDIEEWILKRRIGHQDNNKREAISNELCGLFTEHTFQFASICDYKYYSNFIDFFSEEILSKFPIITVPFLSSDVIESKVNDLLSKMQYPLSMQRDTSLLTNIVSTELKASLITDQTLSIGELGECNFSQHTISVTPELKYDSPRWRFTLTHEIGHYILHKSLCLKNNVSSLYDNENSMYSIISNKDLAVLEIQANKFAASLLLPNELLISYYIRKHKELGLTRYPSLYLDSQPCNISNCMAMFSYLGNAFNVSKEVVKIRLKELSFLTINETTKSLREITYY